MIDELKQPKKNKKVNIKKEESVEEKIEL